MAAESGLYLKQMEIGPMENFVYFVGDKGTREVFVVDPAWQADTILRVAKEENLKIIGALISHYHFDHTNGIVFIDHIKESPDAFFNLKADGKLEPLEYKTAVKDNTELWQE